MNKNDKRNFQWTTEQSHAIWLRSEDLGQLGHKEPQILCLVLSPDYKKDIEVLK